MNRLTRLLTTLLICLLISCYNANSQDTTNVEKWMEYVDELMENSEEDDESLEILYNDLSNLSENPLNLNKATATELARIPFLSEVQIYKILDYRAKQQEFVSIYELKNIEFLDMKTIELILPFVYVGQIDHRQKPTLKNLLKYGKNELIIRYDQCLNEKSGYKQFSDSILERYPNRKYVGEPFYNSVRYSFTFDETLQFGIVGEKDAGEAFMNKTHKGYDFYSAHLFVKDMGIIRNLAVGDYKISFGQGLVVSNDFTPSRSSILSQTERRNNGFRRHYSNNETNYFRGVASSVTIGNLDVNMFYSSRKRDGTVDGDAISSLKNDGLHRTKGDLDKKNDVAVQSLGGNLRYNSKNFIVGMTAMTTSFGDLKLEPSPQPYNLFYFRGNRNTNYSVDYSYRYDRLKFYGETAMSRNGSMATINGLYWSVSGGLNALILYRNYGRSYQSLYGSAFAQSSGVQNEEGLYLSFQWTPVAKLGVSGYADFFRFPWIKYDADAPSSGKEYMLQADFSQTRNTVLSARYRFRRRDKNVLVDKETMISPTDQHRLRLQLTHKPSTLTTLRTTFEGNTQESITSTSRGWMISQSAGRTDKNSKFQADIFAAYFHTDDYYSRIFSKEKNLAYAYNSQFFYGHGLRFSAVLRYNFTRFLYLSAKASWSHYFDRNTIGSDTEEIDGRNKSDISAMLRWKF
ncbi:MAG: helix-hairpin-helix domain-containing protein [Tannerella sp.]|nr:helix-hairpin-helix domain-containing protein [Tannerella sp.]